MIYSIENAALRVEVDSHGAELKSIKAKASNTEYLWQGDPNSWKYRAPFLFPIVGKVNNGKYQAEGKIFELPQHGLARISEFECVEQEDNLLAFEFKYSNETLTKYPYKFSFKVLYILNGNELKVSMQVENLDNKVIYFSFGAHPGFKCPRCEGEKFTDYYLEFNRSETANVYLLDAATGLLNRQSQDYFEDNDKLNLSHDVFKNDALVFKDLKSNAISLKSKHNHKSLTMRFDDFTWFGIWSKATEADFVCLEPWCGHADFVGFNDDISKKDAIEQLNVNESMERNFTLTIED